MPYCKKCGNELSPGAKFCPKCGTPMAISEQIPAPPSSPAPPQPGPRLAFWGELFVAWLIDIIIVGIFIAALDLLTGVIWEPSGYWPGWLPLLNFGSGGLFYFLYWLIMEGVYGQSVGKMAMRLRVTRIDGRPINLGQAALESVGKAFLLVIDVIVGWFLYPRKRQRLFSYLAGTVVIQDHS